MAYFKLSWPCPTRRKNTLVPFWLIATVLLGLLTWLALRTFSPSPPRELTMSTGAPEGAYHQFGLKYQALLKENGVNLIFSSRSA